MPVDPEIDFCEIAAQTEGFSGAELVLICREAGMKALSENIESKKVSIKHIENALTNVMERKGLRPKGEWKKEGLFS